MSTRMCIHGCGEELPPNSRLEECKLCRSSFYRWRYRKATERMERRQKLSLYTSRMDAHFNDSSGKPKKETK